MEEVSLSIPDNDSRRDLGGRLIFECRRARTMATAELEPTCGVGRWFAGCSACGKLHRALVKIEADAQPLFVGPGTSELLTMDLRPFVSSSSLNTVVIALGDVDFGQMEWLRREWAPQHVSMVVDDVSDVPLWGDGWTGLDLPSDVLDELREWQRAEPSAADPQARHAWADWREALLQALRLMYPDVVFEAPL